MTPGYISRVYAILCLAGSLVACSINTSFGDLLDVFSDEPDNGLTSGEMVQGLQAALEKGSRAAINSLGRTDGYYRNDRVRIRLPEKLRKAGDILGELQQDHIVDDFILAMNRAAEQAVPEAIDIFSDAISDLSFKDAKTLLQGPDDAATRYFRRNSGEKLAERMLPLVRQTTNDAGVTTKYKKLVDKLGFASAYIDTKSLDLDRYITGEAINGLFKVLAEEEKRIRTDPAARTSAILQKVFGN